MKKNNTSICITKNTIASNNTFKLLFLIITSAIAGISVFGIHKTRKK